MTLVLPGQEISTDAQRLGPGLQREEGRIIAVKAGLLREQDGSLWIETYSKYYVPSMTEAIVGKVTHKAADFFKVDINTAQPAVLSALAFEGATRRNKPRLEEGSIVYARITQIDNEVELECMAPSGKADGFGELQGGTTASISLELARALLDSQHPIWTAFESLFPFETAIGMNGVVWINAETEYQRSLLITVIEQADRLAKNKLEAMISHFKTKFSQSMDE
jgi:exosome complex component RRP40